MSHTSFSSVHSFRRDEGGTVALIFGVMSMVIFLAAGVGIDYARLHHTNSRLAAAADAAAIAAGKALLDGRLSNADVERVATEFFWANYKEREGYGTIHGLRAKLNRGQNSVEIDVDADVPMTLMKIAGIEKVNLPISSVAIFDQRDIEVGLALDLTGSMCSPCTKLNALKDATKELVDILLPDSGTPNKVRIAFAPYSSGVDAGSYARLVTNNRSARCTQERDGVDPESDGPLVAGTYLQAGATCPNNSPVVPLTSNKRLLKTTVDTYRANGSTAGHLGAQWAWFTVSPNWATVFGAASAPAPYNDGKTIKAVMLMTDGVFNTVGGANLGDTNPQSSNRAKEMCADMRAQGIRVYTVGFKLQDVFPVAARVLAEDTLRSCAGTADHFYNADDEAALRAAFADIAQNINNLRLTK